MNNRGNLYSNRYEKTKDEEYFHESLKDYSKILTIYNKNINVLNNVSVLYLIIYKITKNVESIIQAEKYLNEGLNLYPDNFELINNYGILLYFKYKESNIIDDLNNSEIFLKKAIDDSRIKEGIGETYYYLHLIYDEYAELDENINGYSKEECKKKSDKYLQQSKDLGYKHFMEK